MKKPGTLFIVAAPSGAGKTSLVNEVVRRLRPQCAIERVITYTSRAPREGEVHGRDYYFVTPQEFEQKINEDFFIEWSTTYGTYYGSPRTMLEQLERGISLMCILDRAGTRTVCAIIPNAVRVWLTNDLKILEQRLRARATNTDEQVCKRLALAAKELAEEEAEKLYPHHLVNDDFEKTVSELCSICSSELGRS